MNLSLTGYKETDNLSENGLSRLPPWFKQEIPDAKTLKMAHLCCEFGIHTVCQEAKCPNITCCFKNKSVTFMILGNICTRNCRFCNVKKSEKSSGTVLGLRLSSEPSLFNFRISQVVKMLGLNYVVITSVTRDDLADGGAYIFAQTIESVLRINKDVKVEVLIPDFQGKISSLECVLNANPSVVAHNMETVRRLYGDLRPMADYQLSLEVLRKIKELRPKMMTKSSIMLGLGETEPEVIGVMEDLRLSRCDCLTLGQYLAPSPGHYPVKEFISIGQFQKYRAIGINLGFKAVLSGPLVRSSYRAEEVYNEFLHA